MIPVELKNIPHWITWKFHGKDKKPLSPYGIVANALDPVNWINYRQAVARRIARRLESIELGIGFVLDGDYVVIDGDHEPWISLLVWKFLTKTYCEVSPHGGIHVWLKGSHINERGNFEVYNSKRWMTISEHGNNREIAELTEGDKKWITTHI